MSESDSDRKKAKELAKEIERLLPVAAPVVTSDRELMIYNMAEMLIIIGRNI